jgi:hypothetical protein
MDLDLQEPKNLPWPMSESIHCKPELHVGTWVERERPAYKHLDVSQSYLLHQTPNFKLPQQRKACSSTQLSSL